MKLTANDIKMLDAFTTKLYHLGLIEGGDWINIATSLWNLSVESRILFSVGDILVE